MLKLNNDLKGSLDLFNEVNIVGFVLFVNVIRVYIFFLIFFLNKDIIELKMYVCFVVRCVLGVLIIKYIVLMYKIFLLFCEENSF